MKTPVYYIGYQEALTPEGRSFPLVNLVDGHTTAAYVPGRHEIVGDAPHIRQSRAMLDMLVRCFKSEYCAEGSFPEFLEFQELILKAKGIKA